MIRPAPRPTCLDDAYQWLDEGRLVVACLPRADDVATISMKPFKLTPEDRKFAHHPHPLVRAAFLLSAIVGLREQMSV